MSTPLAPANGVDAGQAPGWPAATALPCSPISGAPWPSRVSRWIWCCTPALRCGWHEGCRGRSSSGIDFCQGPTCADWRCCWAGVRLISAAERWSFPHRCSVSPRFCCVFHSWIRQDPAAEQPAAALVVEKGSPLDPPPAAGTASNQRRQTTPNHSAANASRGETLWTRSGSGPLTAGVCPWPDGSGCRC